MNFEERHDILKFCPKYSDIISIYSETVELFQTNETLRVKTKFWFIPNLYHI